MILRNQAGMQGGGIMCYLCSPDILSNTLVENNAGGLGGGIYMDGSSPTIRHNIVVGCMDGAGIYCRWGSNPVIECNDVWDNAEGNYGGGDCPDETGMNGNISEDPLFCGDATTPVSRIRSVATLPAPRITVLNADSSALCLWAAIPLWQRTGRPGHP